MAILRRRGDEVRRILPMDRDEASEDQSILVIKVPTTGQLQKFVRMSARSIKSGSEEDQKSALKYILGQCLVDIENLTIGDEPFQIDKQEDGLLSEKSTGEIWDLLEEIADEIAKSGVVQPADRKNF